MKALRTVLRAIAPLVLLASVWAKAATVVVNGSSINAAPPEGYCELDSANPKDAELLSQTRRMLRGSNHLVLSFAKCDEIAGFRKGRRQTLDHFGQILVPMPGGQFQKVSMSRPAFVAAANTSAKKIGEQTMKQVDAQMRAATAGSTSLNQNLGVLGTDDAAIYFGLLANAPAEDGSTRVLLGVTGMTVIKQLPVSVNLYEVKRPNSMVSRMLALQQKNLATLVASNP